MISLSDLDDASPFLGRGQSAFSAVTVPCGIDTAIVHNDAHHPYRQRSNICHELAHCFLGHECTPPLTEAGERARDGTIEAEANYLAGTLLMTNEAALHVLRNGIVAQAQHLYGISGAMLTYRLRVSGAHTIYQRMTGYRHKLGEVLHLVHVCTVRRSNALKVSRSAAIWLRLTIPHGHARYRPSAQTMFRRYKEANSIRTHQNALAETAITLIPPELK